MDQLVERVKSLGQQAVAVTDMHNLFGAVDFYLEAKKQGIKPILGCEIHYVPEGRASITPGGANKGHHLVLLCKNLQGYRNLCQMITQSYMDSKVVVKPQAGVPKALIDRDLLSKWGDDLIVLSGCLRGELSYKILTGESEAALDSLLWFKKRFNDDFYLELMDSGIPEQDNVNATLYAWGEKHGIKCVATVDCHYLEPKHAEAHEVLQCIEHGRNLDLDRPKSLVPSEFYVKSGDVMRERMERFPGACDNTQEVADKCNVEFKFKDEKGRPIYHLPNFRPEGVNKGDPFDLIAYFWSQSREGLEKRFKQPDFAEKVAAPDWAGENGKRKEYDARLEGELAMIEKTGFAGYFLIVADFIGWAKANGIPVGPGRGSGAGSLVAYALGITDIDPIEFKLLFERFINPERISMPDFDVDFCQDRRGEVIEYVSRKYGADNVCQIITFGKLQARAVIKDVGRVLGLSFADTDQITKILPDEIDITLEDALLREPRLKERMEADPKVDTLMRYALSLEGLYRSAGMHAAGVIITEDPVVSYCPLFVGREGDSVAQFDKDFCEKIGLVKFDFLGLKTLTVIDNAVKLIKEHPPQAEFELAKMNYKDPKVFALLSSGDTDGVFQVESSGMKDLCTRIQPGSLEDITAINALYRPGPLGSGMVDDFIDRKHGRKPIVYDVDMLEGILRETYGVILYQEQVMQIARELAGYSLGQADLLRRAMGKKKPEEMAAHRDLFVKGATERNLPAAKAESIFDLMAKFAEYGFNKSHSAAYGVITYQTAYLKTYYPAEFMAALMTTEMDTTDKITKYIGDARAHNLRVLPPDVNRSQRKFSVEREEGKMPAIRFGLEAIKGVGGIAVDAIIEARTTTGPFKDVVEFCQRVSTRKVNKKVLESLALAGAFDSILADLNRPSIVASIETLLEHASDEQEERELGQSSLFDAFGSDEIKLVTPRSNLIKQEADWPTSKKLAMEKQVTGFYLSAHPLDSWQRICEEWLGWNVEKIKVFVQNKAKEKAKAPAAPQDFGGGFGGGGGFGPGRFRAPKTEVKLGGLITEMKEVMTKKGSRMAFGTFEDLTGKIEVVFFPEAYAATAETLKRALAEAEVLVLHGEIEIGDEAPKILAKTLEFASEAHKGKVQQVVLKLNPSEVQPDQLRELKKNLMAYPGKCNVRIEFSEPLFRTRLELPKNMLVAGTPQMVRAINQIFGRDVVMLR